MPRRPHPLTQGPSLPSEPEARGLVVEVCRRLYERGLIGAGEGNVSVRLGPRRLLTTPSGTNKGFLRPEDLVTTDYQGRKISGSRAPSSELPMHLAIYAARPDVAAVVHAHPPTAVALTLAGISLEQPLMAEAVSALGGGIPTARYATPSTEAMAKRVAESVAHADAVLMERHGAVAVAADLLLAFDRMETVERVAEVAFRAMLVGRSTPLPQDEVERLLSLRRGEPLERPPLAAPTMEGAPRGAWRPARSVQPSCACGGSGRPGCTGDCENCPRRKAAEAP